MAPTKGKQGTKGAKQIKEENQQTYSFYLYIVIAGNVSFLLYYFLWNYSDMNWTLVFLFVFSSLIYMLCMKTLSSMKNSGLDLNMEAGMAEHVKDVLIVTAVCQGLCCISLYFWFLWLVIPGVALYKLWVNIIAPWVFAPAQELSEKQKKKMEKKRRI